MKLETSSFGTLDYEEKAVIHILEGMLGFPKVYKYILIKNSDIEPFQWLQSVDDVEVAFPVVNPHILVKNYQCAISVEDIRSLELERSDEVTTLVVAIIPEDPLETSVNLRAPLIVNHRKMLGKQIVLADSQYEVAYQLVKTEEKASNAT